VANTIQLLRSTTAGNKPSSLASGQIAINERDAIIYYRAAATGAVTAFPTGGSSLVSYSTTASLPATGSTSVLYLIIDSGKVYQWTGSVYAEVGPVGGGGLPSTISGSLAVNGDDSYSSVSLLLNGNDLVDRSPTPKTVTANGSAAATGAAKFGTNSLSFSGSGYLQVPGSSAFWLPGDFTLECWVNLTAAPPTYSGGYSGSALMGTYAAISGNPGWIFRLNRTSSGYDTINLYTGATNIDWSYSFSLNTWYHVAITRSGSSIKAFVNGTQVGSTVTNSDNMTPSSSTDLWIGRMNLGGYEFQLTGLIDDLRITKGVARSISTPASALPALASYTLSAVTLSIS
jgi:hypothetical protein